MSTGETLSEMDSDAEEKQRLNMEVDVQDLGACKKKLKITIPQEDIKAQFEHQFKDFIDNAAVPGFRAGHAPRKLVERKFRKEASDSVKRDLLLKSLEQIDDELDITPISEPKMDISKIEIPDEGPMVYEFEVEVPPEFDLPDYKGVSINRPIKEFGEADVDKQQDRFLREYAQLEPKDGKVELGDYIVADISFKDGDEEITQADELSIRVQPTLKFSDGTAEDFDKHMVGAGAGDVKDVPVVISSEAMNEELRDKTVTAVVTVNDVKKLVIPELDEDFLGELGYETEQQLRDALHSVLRRRLEYEQRRSARSQLLDTLLDKIEIELPAGLVKRQVQSTLRRQILDLQESGYSEEELRRRYVELQQSSLSSTQRYLREHFLLTKIAETEELEVTPEDVEDQIRMIAYQNDESPRRVRARLERENALDMLEIKILEQMAVDRALEYAEYADVPLEEDEDSNEEAIEASATPEVPEEEEEESQDDAADETAAESKE